jgi:hypothetical protein
VALQRVITLKDFSIYFDSDLTFTLHERFCNISLKKQLYFAFYLKKKKKRKYGSKCNQFFIEEVVLCFFILQKNHFMRE